MESLEDRASKNSFFPDAIKKYSVPVTKGLIMAYVGSQVLLFSGTCFYLGIEGTTSEESKKIVQNSAWYEIGSGAGYYMAHSWNSFDPLEDFSARE